MAWARARGATPVERLALRAMLILTLAGLGVAGYLMKLHANVAGNPKRGLCTFTETISCDTVLASPYAEIAKIPVALVGLAGFALLFAMALWRLIAGTRSLRWLPAVSAAVAGLGLLFELVMTWVDFFVIEAVCPYCLAALAFIGGTFVAATIVWFLKTRNPSQEVHNA
jgi:uncharacterized membrane protein